MTQESCCICNDCIAGYSRVATPTKGSQIGVKVSESNKFPNGSWPEPDDIAPENLLQTVDRALLILMSMADRNDVGVTEVARHFGWNKSTSQRLLATLAFRRFLVADPVTRRYQVGPAAQPLARRWKASGALRVMLQPILDRLTDYTGQTSAFAIPDGTSTRCVCAANGYEGPLRHYPLVGETYPMHIGATSKAYTAHLPSSEWHELLDGRPLARFTERSPVDVSALQKEFAIIRRQGYAFTIGEYDPGVSAMAIPVFVRGALYGSLTSGALAHEMPEPDPHILNWLRQAAQAIDLSLGGAKNSIDRTPPQPSTER